MKVKSICGKEQKNHNRADEGSRTLVSSLEGWGNSRYTTSALLWLGPKVVSDKYVYQILADCVNTRCRFPEKSHLHDIPGWYCRKVLREAKNKKDYRGIRYIPSDSATKPSRTSPFTAMSRRSAGIPEWSAMTDTAASPWIPRYFSTAPLAWRLDPSKRLCV